MTTNYFVNKTPESIATTGICCKFEVTTNQITMTNLRNSSQEIWKDIKGFEGDYEVSNLGNIRSLSGRVQSKNQWGNYIRQRKGHLIKNVIHKCGYYRVDLKGRLYLVHRLVALAFIPNNEDSKEVNHIDGNKLNNSYTNLEWVTKSENIRHADNTGLRKMPKGKDHYMFNRTGAKHHNSKKVICIGTGKVYDSIKIASKVACIEYKYFSSMLSGKVNNKTNFKYNDK